MIARMRASGQHEAIAALGEHAEPLPDWVGYHTTAESMHCPPWETFDPEECQPPKWWWRETRILLDRARSDAREQQDAMRTP